MNHNIFVPKYDKDGKRPLVLWSGGVDSTFLVLDHLNSGRVVDTLSVDAFVSPEKVSREALARLQMYGAFRHSQDMGKAVKQAAAKSFVGGVVDTINLSQACGQGRQTTFRQIIPWVSAIVLHFDPERHSHVELAYVLGDEINAWLHHVAQAVYHLSAVAQYAPIECYFPLAGRRKESLMRALNSWQVTLGSGDATVVRSILNMTWVCELPEAWGHCGECPACKREAQCRKELGIDPRPNVEDDGMPRMGMSSRWGERLKEEDITDYFQKVYPRDQFPQLYMSRPEMTIDEAHDAAIEEDAWRSMGNQPLSETDASGSAEGEMEITEGLPALNEGCYAKL